MAAHQSNERESRGSFLDVREELRATVREEARRTTLP
jgi:hypothetical protein